MADEKDPKPGWADDPPPTVVRDADGEPTDAGKKLAEKNATNDVILARINAARGV